MARRPGLGLIMDGQRIGGEIGNGEITLLFDAVGQIHGVFRIGDDELAQLLLLHFRDPDDVLQEAPDLHVGGDVLDTGDFHPDPLDVSLEVMGRLVQ